MAVSGPWQASAGATLLMPSGNEGAHLYIVLNDPRPFGGYGKNPCVLLVNLSSVHAGVPYDATCALKPGDHPFVTRDSFVFYRNVRIEPEGHVLQLAQQGLFKPHEPMSADVFLKIKAGLYESPHTKREFKRMKL